MPLGAFRLNSLAKFTAEEGGRDTTFSVVGDAQIDTAQSYFGSSSLRVDGDDDMLEVFLDSTLQDTFYTGDWTIEFFLRPDSVTTSGTAQAATNRQGGYGAGVYMFLFSHTDNENRFAAIFANGVDPNQSVSLYSGDDTIPDDTWTHVAVGYDQSSKTVSQWVGGTRTNTITLTYDDNYLNFGSGGFMQGSFGGGTANEFDGWIDETRVSLSDRYGVSNSSITVPTSAFTNDEDTMYLNHFEGADGSTTFEDDDS